MPVKIRELIGRSPTKWVKAWLAILGPPFISLTIVLVVLGAIIAWRNTGYFDLRLFSLTASGLVLIHFATSAFNDYFDFLGGTDNVNYFPTPFSGGSRVIQDGLLKPKTIFFGALILMSLGALIGLYLAYLRGGEIILLGVIGVCCGYGYVKPKINLSKRGLGELAVAVSFGPLMLNGAYFVQAKAFSPDALYLSVIMGLLAASVLWINQIPDYEADSSCGKKNWVVRLGKERSSRIYVFLLAAVFIITFIGISIKILPFNISLVFLALPIAFKASRICLKNFNNVEELLPANALTIALLVIFATLAALAYLI